MDSVNENDTERAAWAGFPNLMLWIAGLLAVFSILAGFGIGSGSGELSGPLGWGVFISGEISALLLYAVAEIVAALRQIARNTRRE